jgi:outer membrane protein OmpA-like peptidoglycan-associated protein
MYLRTLLSCSLAVALVAGAAMAEDSREAVTSMSRVVTNSYGHCVRTKWQADKDVCAPERRAEVAPPPPPPVPVKVDEIAQDKRTVYFDFNKATLRKDAVKTLNNLAELIKSEGGITQFTAHGYADPIGHDKYNQVLSQHRADAVRAYLAKRLNIPSNADVQGMGESHTAECKHYKKRAKRIECLAPDRRVEVELTYKK